MKKFLVLWLSLVSFQAISQTAAEDLQQKLNGFQTMKAQFSQIVKAGKRSLSTSQGSMALSRPGKFRWQTNDPLKQVIVADGQKLWVYDVDLEQVTVKKQGKSLHGTAALFLSGYSDTVTRDFTVVKTEQGTRQIYKLQALSPKETYQKLMLSFVGAELRAIEFYDQLGQHTLVDFNQVKNNPTLAASLFKFSPPKGVDVVEQ